MEHQDSKMEHQDSKMEHQDSKMEHQDSKIVEVLYYLEGVCGWFLMAIFLVTLGHVMIR